MPGAAYIVSIMSSMSWRDVRRDLGHGRRRLVEHRRPRSGGSDGSSRDADSAHLDGPRAARIGCRTRSAVALASALDFGDRVAAELLEERVGEHEARPWLRRRPRRPARRRRRFARWPPVRPACVVRSTERSGFISVEIGFMKPVTRTSSPLVTPPSRPPALLVGRVTASASGWPAEGSRRGRASPAGRPTSGPSADADRLDGLDRHQRLREPAVELAVPLDVAAEPGRHARGRSPRRRRRACRRPPCAASMAAIIRPRVRVSTQRSGESSGSASASSKETTRDAGSVTSPIADDVARDADPERPAGAGGDRAGGHARGGLARAGALEDVAHVVVAVLDGAGEIGVAGPRTRDVGRVSCRWRLPASPARRASSAASSPSRDCG